MFTGIIEDLGLVKKLEREGTNLHISIQSKITPELKIDQSVSHNGVCLTVVDIQSNIYKVTAVEETLKKTNLGALKEGDFVNLERSMAMNGRIDGHIVQGHVDQIAHCQKVENREGSWNYYFQYEPSEGNITVPKGSICVNGVSLTVVNSGIDHFSVTIIPYTYEHTNFKNMQSQTIVNIEFDILGKYVQRYLSLWNKN